MKILLAASEMTPYAKTGGLGDVVGALSWELAELGHDVICCLPYYRPALSRRELGGIWPTGLSFKIPLGSKSATADIYELRSRERLQVLFVRRDEFFDRSELYHTGERAYEDNAERFLFFSKVVSELLGMPKYGREIVHCHDWQSAFVPVEAAARRGTRGPEYAFRSVFTIHNLAYQGLFPAADFALTNLPAEFFKPEALEFYGQMNLMKGGIVFADAVTTVSKTYAKEIQTPENGFGLDAVLRARKQDVFGILNGADYRTWNPATDAAIKQPYSAADLSGKRVCRADLARRLGLDVDDETPIAAVISRLTELKGMDLLAEAIEELVGMGAALVVLGRGAEKYEAFFAKAAEKHPKRIAAVFDHNEELAHQIQAGADILLMPSRSEPCGLTQMYALKYGTIPVVRATGGLEDTIQQFDAKTGKGTGFKFREYTAAALVGAVRQAILLHKQPTTWQKLMRNAMACDFSWRASAEEYVKLYAAL